MPLRITTSYPGREVRQADRRRSVATVNVRRIGASLWHKLDYYPEYAGSGYRDNHPGNGHRTDRRAAESAARLCRVLHHARFSWPARSADRAVAQRDDRRAIRHHRHTDQLLADSWNSGEPRT